MTSIPRPAIRRPITLVALPVLLVLFLLVSVVVIPALVLIDLLTRSRLRRARFWCLLGGTLVLEAVGTVAGLALLLRHARSPRGPEATRKFHRLEQWWARQHGRNLARFAGVRWMVENPDALATRNAVLLARHSSHVDSILPILVFTTGSSGPDEFKFRYTLKAELQWTPAMDIVGNLLPNVFVDRSRNTDAPTLDEIEALGRGMDEASLGVVFPEGTFYSPEGLERAVARIRERDPDQADRAAGLRHLLPPRPAGTLAFLRGAPDASLVLMGHVGMEAFGEISEIRAALPLTEPVRIRLWTYDRSEIPDDEDELTSWLLDRWLEVDSWIHERVVTGTAAFFPHPPRPERPEGVEHE